MLGPYIKSRGTRVIEMSENADLITVYNKGNNLKTSSKFIFWAIWGALRESSIMRLGLSSFPTILSLISMYMSNKEAI